MNSKQSKTLKSIFSQPTKSNINWEDIEKFMLSIGAKIKEGKGSAGVFILKGKAFPFHRPHPQKEAKKYQIQDLKKFLIEQGVEYEE
jgi:hypothetical protein